MYTCGKIITFLGAIAVLVGYKFFDKLQKGFAEQL